MTATKRNISLPTSKEAHSPRLVLPSGYSGCVLGTSLTTPSDAFPVSHSWILSTSVLIYTDSPVVTAEAARRPSAKVALDETLL